MLFSLHQLEVRMYLPQDHGNKFYVETICTSWLKLQSCSAYSKWRNTSSWLNKWSSELLPTTAQVSLNPIQQVKSLSTSAIKQEKIGDKFLSPCGNRVKWNWPCRVKMSMHESRGLYQTNSKTVNQHTGPISHAFDTLLQWDGCMCITLWHQTGTLTE